MILRINKFIALSLSISRRRAEELINSGRIKLNDAPAELTDRVSENDSIFLDGKQIKLEISEDVVLILNKPLGYVCTHASQGGDPGIFELLPSEYGKLKIAGRLDKDTSGLVILTNKGDFAHKLTHPSFKKQKTYITKLKRELAPSELNLIKVSGVDIGDERASKFKIEKLGDLNYRLILEEGRNRQIRRTFKAIGNEVVELHRLSLGEFSLDNLKPGEWVKV